MYLSIDCETLIFEEKQYPMYYSTDNRNPISTFCSYSINNSCKRIELFQSYFKFYLFFIFASASLRFFIWCNMDSYINNFRALDTLYLTFFSNMALYPVVECITGAYVENSECPLIKMFGDCCALDNLFLLLCTQWDILKQILKYSANQIK